MRHPMLSTCQKWQNEGYSMVLEPCNLFCFVFYIYKQQYEVSYENEMMYFDCMQKLGAG